MTLQELLGIELPIIQAPMAGVQGSALAIAVSRAGGLGSLPCAMLTLEVIRAELTAIRAALTSPYNVNFFCHAPPAADPARDAAWRARLAPYCEEFGIAPDGPAKAGPHIPSVVGAGFSRPAIGGRSPFDEHAAEIVEEFKPAVVSFHFGLPSSHLLARVKSAGAVVLSSATTVDEARWLEARGVDAIVAQGWEAGGHRGMFLSDDLTTQAGTLALVRQVVDAVRVPVIAAGGIADAQGVAAALALGAAGVQVGTAYLLCPEATTSAVHRRALKSDRAAHTAVTNVFSGRPARGIVNRAIRELGPMSDAAPPFPLAAAAVGPLRAAAEATARDDFSPLWCGQNARGCREIPAAQLTRELAGRT